MAKRLIFTAGAPCAAVAILAYRGHGWIETHFWLVAIAAWLVMGTAAFALFSYARHGATVRPPDGSSGCI